MYRLDGDPMPALTLTLRAPPRQPLDLTPLLPEHLVGLSKRALAAIVLRLGNRPLPLGELFDIRPGDPDTVVVAGGTSLCDRLGAGMSRGTIIVEGDAGAQLGFAMTGGTIEVRGSAGDLAAAEASGGVVRIAGDAGARLGGALPGAGGMAGGAVLVRGGCGERAGERMRKGLVVVESDAGAHAGVGLRGGTVLVLGRCGPDPAPLMRRGTVLLAQAPERMLPTFADDGRHELLWLTLLGRHLASLGWPAALPGRGVRRFAGDLADFGKGELLIAG
jgi:formylmethanofuran dehydrogenase subunit C